MDFAAPFIVLCRCVQHVFDEDAIAGIRGIDQDVSDVMMPTII